MNSKHWGWLDGICYKHRDQSLPCKTCIENNDPDVVYDASDGPNPLPQQNPCCEIGLNDKMPFREEIVQKYVDLWKQGNGITLVPGELTGREIDEIQRRVEKLLATLGRLATPRMNNPIHRRK